MPSERDRENAAAGLNLAALPDHLSAAEVLALLEPQIRRHLRERRDWLLSKLYRLDVRERDIKAALASDTDAATALASLILARHHERMATRALHRPLDEPWDAELGDMSW